MKDKVDNHELGRIRNAFREWIRIAYIDKGQSAVCLQMFGPDIDHSWLLERLLRGHEPRQRGECRHKLPWDKARCCGFGIAKAKGEGDG